MLQATDEGASTEGPSAGAPVSPASYRQCASVTARVAPSVVRTVSPQRGVNDIVSVLPVPLPSTTVVVTLPVVGKQHPGRFGVSEKPMAMS